MSRRSSILLLTIALVAECLSAVATGKEQTGFQAGWHLRRDGSWPWTSNTGDGSYLCLRWNHGSEAFDTLTSPEHYVKGCDSLVLSVRTFYEPGVPFPGPGDLPTVQLLYSTDRGESWSELRYYGFNRCDSHERYVLSSRVAAARTVRFAWACHVYDSANIRWWCIDDIDAKVFPDPVSPVFIRGFFSPTPRMTYAPGDEVQIALQVGGATLEADWRLNVDCWLDNEIERQYTQQVGGLRPDVPIQIARMKDVAEGRHTLFATLNRHVYNPITEAHEIEPVGHDTTKVEFRVDADVWQRMPEYPAPDRLVGPGLAAAVSRRSWLHVRNPGLVDVRDSTNARMFLSWSQLSQNWSPVRSYEEFYSRLGTPSFQLGAAEVVDDSVFFCLTDSTGPLMVWHFGKNEWSLTPPLSTLRSEAGHGVCALASLSWDGGDALYVVGRDRLYRYSVSGSLWDTPAVNAVLPSVCPEHTGAAFLDGKLYVVFADGQLGAYNPDADEWSLLQAVPGSRPVSICRLAADPHRGVLYALTDAIGFHRAFIAYDVADERWILDLVQPRWQEDKISLRSGATLVRGGRYLYAFNGDDNDLYTYTLP